MGRRATLADVAKRAGLSLTAASLVMNNRPATRISPEAAERVRAAARELDYKPNAAARMLSTSRSESIGFVSDGVATQRYASALIHGAMTEARRRDHMLLIAETEGDPIREVETVESLVDRYVEGIIFASARSREIELPTEQIGARHVVLNASAGPGHISILPDEYAAGQEAPQVLAQAGILDGVVLLGRQFNQEADRLFSVTVRRRLEGIRAGIAATGLSLQAELRCTVWDPEVGYRVMSQYLATGAEPRGIIALNDRLALGAYQALAEYDLQVPDDVSVISFDDDDIAQYLRPQLTTLALPYERMGELAVEILLTEATGQEEYLIPMPLRRRQSVASPHLN